MAALLLEEPLQAVHACTVAPSRLHAMQLVNVPDGKSMSLYSYFEPMQVLRSVLETEHLALDGALEFLRHPPRPWFFDEDAPDALLHEWFDPELANAMSAEMSGSDLAAQQVTALVG